MPADMLVKLYELPPLQPVIQAQQERGILIRRGLAPEKHLVANWVRGEFNEYWVSECEVAFAHQPVGCFIAIENGVLLGFACYDTTARGFFGPTGVDKNAQGKGIGKALLIAALHDMRNQGYGYAIIGGAGPMDFYAKAVGAIEIENSWPGVYGTMLRDS